MKKLKTLKDFEYVDNPKDDSSPLIVKSNRLRAEAIKWVKEDRKCMKDMVRDEYLFICAYARIDFIIDFFNLTEADLE